MNMLFKFAHAVKVLVTPAGLQTVGGNVCAELFQNHRLAKPSPYKIIFPRPSCAI